MKNKLLYISAFLLTFTLAVVAYAQVNPRTLGDVFGFKAVVITKLSGVSDTRAGALHIGRLGSEFPSTTNRITRYLAGSAAFLNADGGTSFSRCAEATATITGARLGDNCFASIPDQMFVDAGPNQTLLCRVSATDTVTVRICPEAPDVVTIPRAKQIPITVISNQ